MGVLKFDMTDVEPGQDFDTPIPKGVYKMRILEIEDGESNRDGRPMYTVELEVTEGEYKGRRLWDYIKYEDDTSQWKLRQLLEALQVISKTGKQKGSFNPQKYEGTVLVVRVKHETDDDYGAQAKVGSLQPLPEGETEEAAAEEPDAEAGEPDASGGDDGDDEITAANVREMDLDELKELAEEQELADIKFTKRSNVDKKRDEVIEALELVDLIEDPEDWDDLTSLDREELEAYVEQEELELEFDDDTEDEELCKLIAEELEIEVPDDAGGDDDKTPDFSDMSVADLKAACKEHGLETKGGKKGMIKRLEKAAAASDGSDPF